MDFTYFNKLPYAVHAAQSSATYDDEKGKDGGLKKTREQDRQTDGREERIMPLLTAEC